MSHSDVIADPSRASEYHASQHRATHRGTIPVPAITPEMIVERETAHLRADERRAAALNVPEPSPSPLTSPLIPISKEDVIALANRYGLSVVDADEFARFDVLREQNGKLVERVNRAEKEAADLRSASSKA